VKRGGAIVAIVLVAAAGAAGFWYWKKMQAETHPAEVWERRVDKDVKLTGPTLAVSPNGKWFAIAWAEGSRVWWMRGTTEAGRMRFDTPATLPDTTYPFTAFDEDPPKPAVDDDGQVAVAWMSRPWGRDDGTVIAVARPNLDRDGRVSLTRIEPSDAKAFLLCESLHYDDDGRLLAVWVDGGRPADSRGEAGVLQAAVASPQGAFEGVTALTDSVCACCRTAIAWLGPDHFAFSFRSVEPANVRDIQFGVLEEEGTSGATPPRFADASRALARRDGWTIEGCPSQGPSVAAAGENAAWIAWYTEGTPRGLALARLASTRAADGVRWRTVKTYAIDDRREAGHPAVATLASGRPFVAFEGPTPEGGRALFARTIKRDVLGPAVRFTTATRATRPSPARWNKNDVLIAWQENDEYGPRLTLAEWPRP
jgi:hypothetical protein